MSKRIESTSKRWPGYVILSDPLTFPQLFAFEDTQEAARGIGTEDGNVRRLLYATLPGLIACVEEGHLEGFPEQPTAETWPATPINASANLVSWLFGEIVQLYAEAEEIPNA